MFKIKIKNQSWKIKLVADDSKYLERQDDEMSVCGITHFAHATIYINREIDKSVMLDTITHELTHAYLFVYGFGQVENFTEEMLCDIMGAYARDIITQADEIFQWALAQK